jgi:hypothetical protein
VTAGCAAGPVRLAVPSSDPAADPEVAAACKKLSGALPGTVVGQERRETEPPHVRTAAWGDPAVTLRCGVPQPEALVPTAQLVTVNGVDWLPEELTRGWRFTTTGRVAFVEVDVPEAYRPEVDALVDLADAVSAAVPVRDAAG